MKQIFAAISGLWHKLLGHTDAFILAHLDEAVNVAKFIKGLLDNPIVEGVIAFTPTGIDDKIAGEVKDKTEAVLKLLLKAQSCEQEPDQDARLACMLKAVQDLHTDRSIGGFVRDFAAAYLQHVAPEAKLSDLLSDTITQNKVFEDLQAKA